MFSGLSSFFKKILPKRLFYRAILITAIPVLVLQLVITIVFFDSLWIKTNKGMTRALVNEISTFIDRGKLKNKERGGAKATTRFVNKKGRFLCVPEVGRGDIVWTQYSNRSAHNRVNFYCVPALEFCLFPSKLKWDSSPSL